MGRGGNRSRYAAGAADSDSDMDEPVTPKAKKPTSKSPFASFSAIASPHAAMANPRGEGHRLGHRLRRRRHRQAHGRGQEQGGPGSRPRRIHSAQRRGSHGVQGRGTPTDTGRAGSRTVPAQNRHRRHGRRVRPRHRAVLQLPTVDVRAVLHPLRTQHPDHHDRARRQVLRSVLRVKEQHGVPADVGRGVRHGVNHLRVHRPGRCPRRGLAQVHERGRRAGSLFDQDGFPLRRRHGGHTGMYTVPGHVRVLRQASTADRAGRWTRTPSRSPTTRS